MLALRQAKEQLKADLLKSVEAHCRAIKRAEAADQALASAKVKLTITSQVRSRWCNSRQTMRRHLHVLRSALQAHELYLPNNAVAGAQPEVVCINPDAGTTPASARGRQPAPSKPLCITSPANMRNHLICHWLACIHHRTLRKCGSIMAACSKWLKNKLRRWTVLRW